MYIYISIMFIYIYIYMFISIYIYMYILCIYIYIFIYTNPCRSRPPCVGASNHRAACQVGPYTILLLPMLYGAWHTRGGSTGNHTLRDIVCGRNTGGRSNGGVSCQ